MFELIIEVLVEYWVVALSGFVVWLLKKYYENKSKKRELMNQKELEIERERIRKREEELFLMDCYQTSIRALLRDRIYQAYIHYTEKGFLPLYAKENVNEMHIEYVKLRGNGMVEGLMKELNSLPSLSPKEKN